MKQSVLTDYLFSKASRLGIPLSGTFEISPICNFKCRMCYVRKSQAQVDASSRKMMSLNEWLAIAEEAKQLGMLHLLITGGEPLLWPDFWKLYESLVDMGFLVSVNTNGSLIDETAVRRFVEKPPRRINITLYGAGDSSYCDLCQIRGAYERVEHAIRMLKNARICVKLNCSVTPQNKDDLKLIADYSKEHNIPLQIASYMFPPIRTNPDRVGENERFTPREAAFYRLKSYELQNSKEAYEDLLKRLAAGEGLPIGLDESCEDPMDGTLQCRAGKSTFWITWDGWMSPCGMMTEPFVDVRKHSFPEAWDKIMQLSKEIIMTGKCRDCPDHSVCHACAAMALAENGAFKSVPKYLCEMTKEMKILAREYLVSHISK